jgi:hypothetical protein
VTWYAHQVFAEPRRDVVDALRPAFGDALFRISGLPAHWTKSVPLEMPAEGLLVVRELCAPPGDDPDVTPWTWFGSDAVSWLVAPEAGDQPPFAPAAASAALSSAGAGHPPADLLLLLRRVSVSTDTVVSLYGAGFWGGDIEYAYAWVFPGRTGGDRVYLHADDGSVQVWAREDPLRPRRVVPGGDVLNMALGHHGVHLDGGYFEAHTRGFDWPRYRLGTEGERP